MKNIEVIEKFINGCISSGGNLTSTSDRLYSYQTCIAERTKNGYIINKTKYSVTTSKHVGMLLNQLHHTNVKYVEDVPKGAKRLWIEIPAS